MAHRDVRQLHAHEDPCREKGDEDTEEADGDQEDAIETWQQRVMSLVQDDEAKGADREQETGSQSFHDVLAVHAVRHEGNGTRVAVLIDRRPDARRLHDDVVDDAWCACTGVTDMRHEHT